MVKFYLCPLVLLAACQAGEIPHSPQPASVSWGDASIDLSPDRGTAAAAWSEPGADAAIGGSDGPTPIAPPPMGAPSSQGLAPPPRNPELFLDLCDYQSITQITFHDRVVYVSAGKEGLNDAGIVQDNGIVRARPEFDGPAYTLWAGSGEATGIAIVDGRAFVLRFDYPGRDGSLLRVDPSSAEPEVVPGSVWNSQGSCSAITSGTHSVYFSFSTGSTGSIMSAATTGPARLLATSDPCAPGLVSDGADLYSIAFNSVFDVAKNGDSSSTVFTNALPITYLVGRPSHPLIFSDHSGVFFLDANDGSVTAALPNALDVKGLASDERFAYASRADNDTIDRISIYGQRDIRSLPVVKPSLVAASKYFLYWVSNVCQIERISLNAFDK
jgi:hypothetical protein